MRIASGLLSLVLHVGIILLGFYMPWQGASAPIDMDLPVYEVDLVRAPAPGPEESVPETLTEPEEPASEDVAQIEEPQETLETEESEPAAEEQGPAAREVARAPEEESSREAVQLERERRQEPKPEAAPRERQDPEARPEPEPRQESRPGPSREDLLSSALGEIRDQAQQEQKQEQERSRDVLERELARLRSQAEEGGLETPAGARAGSRVDDVYALRVRDVIKEKWRFPSLGSREDLSATVNIVINDQGQITDFSLESGSGRSDFDNSVLRAVEDTEDLPRPPRERLRNITVTFHSQEMN